MLREWSCEVRATVSAFGHGELDGSARHLGIASFPMARHRGSVAGVLLTRGGAVEKHCRLAVDDGFNGVEIHWRAGVAIHINAVSIRRGSRVATRSHYDSSHRVITAQR